MRLINKSDLAYRDGMVFEKATGQLVSIPGLANEINEITDMNELVAFAVTNRKELETEPEHLEFKPAKTERPTFKSGRTVPTPLQDAETDKAKAIAEEFLAVKDAEKVDMQLARYNTIAAWLDKDYIVTDNDGFGFTPFKTNPFEVTEAWVIESVTAFRNPDMAKLLNKIDIDE